MFTVEMKEGLEFRNFWASLSDDEKEHYRTIEPKVLRHLPITSTGMPIVPRIDEIIVDDGKLYKVVGVFWEFGNYEIEVCPKNKVEVFVELMTQVSPDKVLTEEQDRNARAYGWEVGQGAPIADNLPESPGNPFSDPDWRQKN
jgi:hypothetical protein